MTECFQKIIAKKGLIQKIRIDHETLEFSYFNKNGQKVDHQMLSSGEKQILVIAMLWALGICSKAEFPLIIDTPLARLDSVPPHKPDRELFSEGKRPGDHPVH